MTTQDPPTLASGFEVPTDKSGAFVRRDSVFRSWVTTDGSSDFIAEAGRYHLYVSLACPWAHRTIIFRKLKRLERVISLSVVDPIRDERAGRSATFPVPARTRSTVLSSCPRPTARPTRRTPAT